MRHVEVHHLELMTADGPMSISVAEPQTGTTSIRGAVIVVQEAFGVNHHIEDVCQRFAAASWLAISPTLYHRAGSPTFAYDDLTGIREALSSFTASGIGTDLDACHNYLAGRGFGLTQTATVGFCMGGLVSLFAGTRRALGASATFYGGGLGTSRFGLEPGNDMAARLQTPLLGLFGDLDQSIPVDEVEQLRAAAAHTSAPSEIVRYATADHGFHCDQRPNVFNSQAASDAWTRTLAWFDSHVARP